MRTELVHAFYWTATLGSQAAAAERLNVTQPTINEYLKELQKVLSAPLFVPGSSVLTEHGLRALPAVKRLLDSEQAVLDELGLSACRPVRFRLGVIESVLHSSLSDLIAALRARQPRLNLEMTVHSTVELVKRVNHAELDMVIAALPATGRYVQTCAAAPLEMVFVGNMSLHKKARYTLNELAVQGLVGFQADSQPHRQLNKLLKECGQDAVVHPVSSISAMLALVRAGFGVATLPRVVAESLHEPGLRILRCEQELAQLPIHISLRADPGEPRLNELFAIVTEFIQRSCAARPGLPPQ